MVADVLKNFLGLCNYPLACGRKAICSGNQQCSCPVSSSPGRDYFRAVNDRQPNLGCSEITHLTCNATHDQTFIELENAMYFSIYADMEGVDIESCKQACKTIAHAKSKAALLQYGLDSTNSRFFYHLSSSQ